MANLSARVASRGQAPCKGGRLRPTSPARGLPTTAWAAYKTRSQAVEAAARRGGACEHDAHRHATCGQKLMPARATARRSTRRGDAHGGVAREHRASRKGSSVHPLAGRLLTSKGGDNGAMRVREEGYGILLRKG
ncbi:hypothetical protein B296_00008145 [Ensete ventricosum]|uniref:Uncharacterized protein n=1 Tax=Ensete ventricosum TaxID=4639 RepID=A0A426YNS9_ENSVE|nr:hypothetical protein B296_00008145 [Ensete ventricosum]